MKLYGYWRSSAAYRLRIALNLKGATYDTQSVNIAPAASEQIAPAFKSLNPQMRVPVLEVGGHFMTQSMAVLEWLDETYPEPPLLPADPFARQRARAFADLIACDIHPLNNLSVLNVLRSDFGADKAAVRAWYGDWIIRGFTALEAQIADRPASGFLFGEAPGIAEICLVPQVYNARRFEIDLSDFPALVAVDAACTELKAFQDAAPDAQPDAVTPA